MRRNYSSNTIIIIDEPYVELGEQCVFVFDVKNSITAEDDIEWVPWKLAFSHICHFKLHLPDTKAHTRQLLFQRDTPAIKATFHETTVSP